MTGPWGTARRVTARAGAAFQGALAVAVIVSVGSCGSSEPRGSAPQADHGSAGCEVRDTTQQVADRFSGLGKVVSAEWCAIDLTGGSSRVPGPSDIRMVGCFETTATDMRRILDDRDREFERVETVDVPEPLRRCVGGPSEWVTSTEIDEEITGGLYTATFSFDRLSNRVLFDTVNPVRTQDEGVVVGG
ncbi:hypothetical protein [Streptomyces sp. NPDC012510]|uniref:hypothetical protein n=1 Tax=Streptomyces sp. NPDC012510 TaxID=3364838 RepID=UPI0036E71DA5